METEVRFYYAKEDFEKILTFLKGIEGLNYKGEFYEKTIQYDHPCKEESFYTNKVDGRYRLRISKGENSSYAMITWKRRLKKTKNELINSEEEIEVRINPEDFYNQEILLEKILKMKKVESYERKRNIFSNEDIEVAVDYYPFGIALEIENKSMNKNAIENISRWIEVLGLDVKDAFKLSWDDKYTSLCKEQNVEITKNVNFESVMPSEKRRFGICI